MKKQSLTSLQHPIVKSLVELRKKASARQSANEVLVVGKNLILELSKHFLFKKVLFSDPSLITSHVRSDEFFQVTDGIIKKISGLVHPEKVVATLALPKEKDLSNQQYLLVLDQINDPGNLGTLFRSAWALGFEGIYLVDECVDPFNDKAIRAAKGANFHIPYKKTSFEQISSLLEKGNSFTADMHGKIFTDIDCKKPLYLILGSESHGIRPGFKKFAKSIKIPMYNDVESLNVAIAGSILMQNLRTAHG